jgi:hypothetical protein
MVKPEIEFRRNTPRKALIRPINLGLSFIYASSMLHLCFISAIVKPTFRKQLILIQLCEKHAGE